MESSIVNIEKLIKNKLSEQEKLKASNKWKDYTYDNKPIPRVTDVIHTMIHEDKLLSWANSLGFKRKGYKSELDKSANIGTISHNLIETFAKDNKRKINFSDVNYIYRESVRNAYGSYVDWFYNATKTRNINILEIEKRMISPFVGGTLDILASINKRTYIIDLKTSNQMTYKYFLQLAAYQYLIESYYNTLIDGGIMVLLLNKKTTLCEEFLLDFSIEEHVKASNQFKETFISLLYGYYNISISSDIYSKIFKGRCKK